jgi:pyruvate dehydrogenase E1 component alpha subunit
MLTPEQEAAMRLQYTREVDAAVQEYLNTPPPTTDAMFDYLFAHPPAYIEEQKVVARRYAGRVKGHGAN